MNMDELLLKLKKDYISDIPVKITELNQLYKTNNVLELKDAFHKLKGSGKTYGVAPVSLLGKEMERICGENPQVLTAQLFSQALSLLDSIAKEQLTSEEQTLKDPRFQILKAS
ncbi:MAG: Hpt domain-containing protein [Bdellovibrionaceae bacterium]|nr:Hpt domain-containing protein [Pseudobdellovibrionaceae bacterium]